MHPPRFRSSWAWITFARTATPSPLPLVNRRRFAVLIVAGVLAALTLPVRAAAQDEFAVDAARLAKALGLAAGQTVADIGAGSGELTVALARVVGPTGRLYATELESDKIRAIR